MESADPISYPAVDPGCPAVPVSDIIDRNVELITRAQLAYGTGSADFARHVQPLIRRYAEYVHLLPATPDNYFKSHGGLFRLGLEVAFLSLQATDSQIFSGGGTIRVRRELEPRWRLATFVAGLCHEVHRTLSHLVVTDESGREWPAYLTPLSTWLTENQLDRYYVKWVPNTFELRSLGVFVLPHVADRETLQYLSSGNSIVVPTMMGCVSGMVASREPSVLDKLVRRAAAAVIDLDLRASTERYGKPILGSHLERYLLDAMRRLLSSNEAWAPNGDKSRVWLGLDGLFVVWPNAAADVVRLLEGDQVPGIPKAAETLLEVLVASGIAVSDSEGNPIWTIYPGEGLPEKPVSAIRLPMPDLLLPSDGAHSFKPLGRALLVPVNIAKANPQSKGAPERPRGATEAQAALNFDQSGSSQSAPAASIAPKNTPPGQHDGHLPGEATAPASPDAFSAVVEEPESNSAAPARFALRCPIRLSPIVREALETVVESVNGDAGPILARTVPDGLFVPLRSFNKLSVDSGIAIRSLADCSMLILSGAGSSKTTEHEFDGEILSGVLIPPKFIEGLLVDDVATPEG